MAQCTTCGNYYRRSPYNVTNECDACVDQLLPPVFNSFDEEDLLDVETLLNPCGKVQARFSD